MDASHDRLARLEGSVAAALELLERSARQMARLEGTLQRSLSTESTLADASLAYERHAILGVSGGLSREQRQDSATYSAASSEEGQALYEVRLHGGSSLSNAFRQPPSYRKPLRSSLPVHLSRCVRGYRSADDVRLRDRTSSVDAQWGETPPRVGFGRGLSDSSLRAPAFASPGVPPPAPYYQKFRDSEAPAASPQQHHYASPPPQSRRSSARPPQEMEQQQPHRSPPPSTSARALSPRRTPGRAPMPFAKPDLPYLAAMGERTLAGGEAPSTDEPADDAATHPPGLLGHPSRRRNRAPRPSGTALPRAGSDDSPEAESPEAAREKGAEDEPTVAEAAASHQSSSAAPPRRGSSVFAPSPAPWADHSVTQTTAERDAASLSQPNGQLRRPGGPRGGRGPPPNRGFSPRRPSVAAADPSADPPPRKEFRFAGDGPDGGTQPHVRAAAVDPATSRYLASMLGAPEDRSGHNSDSSGGGSEL
jgi:hypothetical protein